VKIKTGIYVYPASGRKIRIRYVSAPEDKDGLPGMSVDWIGQRRKGFYPGIYTDKHMSESQWFSHAQFVRPLNKGGR
jgi:hypothetical protein